jgi:hypothetical protein
MVFIVKGVIWVGEENQYIRLMKIENGLSKNPK